MVISTTKPVMAYLAILLYAIIIDISNCAPGVQIHCLPPDGTKKCIVPNDNGVLQFTVMKDSASTTDIIVPNLHLNKKLGTDVSLKLTIEGATVDQADEVENDKEWSLTYSDGAVGNMIVEAKSGVINNVLSWPASSNANSKREVCIHLGTDQSWYSTFQQKTQRWPMDLTQKLVSYPLNSIPLDTNSEIDFIVEHLFFSSKGFAIRLERDMPLWLRIVPNATDPLMCVTARKDAPYDTKNSDPTYTNIKFNIYTGANIHDVYDAVSNKLENIPKPADIPSDAMFTSPIWSIIPGKGSFFPSDAEFNQAKVVQFAKDLNERNYRNNSFLLEGDWTVDAPFLTFNQTKFLDPKMMAKDIHDLGCKLDLLVHPYVKSDSNYYTSNKEAFVKDKSGSGGLMIRNGPFNSRYIVDFSNITAIDDFKGNLTKLKADSGVDSFVFGSITFPDNNFAFSDADTQKDPVIFGENYVKLAGDFGNCTVVRDGHGTQGLAVFTQMSDRVSDWSFEKGLKSLIPAALAMSIGGYSYIIPDVIGGRTGDKPLPDNELYIRWAQAITFLPTMHFAIAPWEYDDKTVNLVKELVTLHASYLNVFVELARKRSKDGTPMIRPMWFVAPLDERSFKVEDQFMLGNDLLVAPVLQPGVRVRSVYFPEGSWQNAHDHSIISTAGFHQVRAPIDLLPYFKRISP